MAAKNEDHDPHFEPLISLPERYVPKLEEDEDVLFKMRAKLFRWASEADPPEWKERGTGDVKILKHKDTSKVRLLMRRDKTYKICANHFLLKSMTLQPNCGSDRAWVWNAFADYADEEPSDELFAIRFRNAENANLFKEKFDECKLFNSDFVAKEENGSAKIVEKDKDVSCGSEQKVEKASPEEDKEADKVAQKLEDLTVKENEVEEKSSDDNLEKNKDPVEDSPEK